MDLDNARKYNTLNEKVSIRKRFVVLIYSTVLAFYTPERIFFADNDIHPTKKNNISPFNGEILHILAPPLLTVNK